jgi:general secretion pathway protein G
MKKLHLTGEKGFTLIELMVVMIIPSTDQGLEALVSEPNTEPLPSKYREGGYLEKGKVPKDPWGHDFIYLSPGLHSEFDIVSYGSDGIEGGEGKDADVESWNIE